MQKGEKHSTRLPTTDLYHPWLAKEPSQERDAQTTCGDLPLGMAGSDNQRPGDIPAAPDLFLVPPTSSSVPGKRRAGWTAPEIGTTNEDSLFLVLRNTNMDICSPLCLNGSAQPFSSAVRSRVEMLEFRQHWKTPARSDAAMVLYPGRPWIITQMRGPASFL